MAVQERSEFLLEFALDGAAKSRATEIGLRYELSAWRNDNGENCLPVVSVEIADAKTK